MLAALVPLLTALPLAAQAVPGGPAQARGPKAQAERALVHAGNSLGAGLYRRRPWLLRERALTPIEHDTYRPGSDEARWWRWFVDSSRADLAAVSERDLSPRRQLDLDRLRAWVEVAGVLGITQSLERRNPGWYVDGAEQYLRSLVATGTGSVDTRARDIQRELERLPRVLADARRTLSTPIKSASADALLTLVDLAHFLQYELPSSLGPLEWRREERAALDRLRRAAIAATLEFRNWLAGRPSRSGGPPAPIGPVGWERMAWEATGTDMSTSEVKTRVLRDLARLEPLWTKAKPTSGAPPSPAMLEAAVRSGSRRALEIAIESGLLLDPGRELEAHARRDFAAPGSELRVWSPQRNVFRVELELPGEAWTPAATAARTALLTPDVARAAGILYGFPGESLWRYEALRMSDRGAATVWSPAAREGWSLYVLDWLPRVDWVESPIDDDPALIGGMARLRALAGARLLLSIEAHSEELEADGLVSRFRRRTQLDETTARRELERVYRDPLIGIGYLGYIEIVRFEKAVRERMPPRRALGATIDVLLGNPNARPADVFERFAELGPR